MLSSFNPSNLGPMAINYYCQIKLGKILLSPMLTNISSDPYQ